MKFIYIILFGMLFNINYSMDLDAILNEALQDFSNSENKKMSKKDEHKFIKELEKNITPLYSEIVNYVELCKANPTRPVALNAKKTILVVNKINNKLFEIKNSNNNDQKNILKNFIIEKNNLLIDQGIEYQNIHIYIEAVNMISRLEYKSMLKGIDLPKNININFPEAILQDFVSRNYIITGLIDKLYEKIEYISNHFENSTEKSVQIELDPTYAKNLYIITCGINNFYKLAETIDKNNITEYITEKNKELLDRKNPVYSGILEIYIEQFAKQPIEQVGLTDNFSYPAIILKNMKQLEKKREQNRKRKQKQRAKNKAKKKAKQEELLIQEALYLNESINNSTNKITEDIKTDENKNNDLSNIEKIKKTKPLFRIKKERRKTLAVAKKTSNLIQKDTIELAIQPVNSVVEKTIDFDTKKIDIQPKKKAIERKPSYQDIIKELHNLPAYTDKNIQKQKKLIRTQSAVNIRKERRKTKKDKISSKMTFEESINYFVNKYNAEIKPKKGRNGTKIIIGNLKETTYTPGHSKRNEIGADEARKLKEFEKKIKNLHLHDNKKVN